MHPLLFLQFNLICRVFLKCTLKLNPCSSSISCGMKKETAQTNVSCHQRSGCLWRKSSLKTHGLVHITSARERNIYGLSPNFWPLKLKALSPPPFSQLTHRKNVSLYSWEKFLCAQRYSYIDEWSNSALPPKSSLPKGEIKAQTARKQGSWTVPCPLPSTGEERPVPTGYQNFQLSILLQVGSQLEAKYV